MSRLYDRLLRDGTWGLEDGAPVVLASNVAEYFWTSRRENWPVDALPNLAPPFPRFFVECRAPQFIDSEACAGPIRWSDTGLVDFQTWGVDIACIEPDQVPKTIALLTRQLSPDQSAAIAQRVAEAFASESLQWILSVALYVESYGERMRPFRRLYSVESDGRPRWLIDAFEANLGLVQAANDPNSEDHAAAEVTHTVMSMLMLSSLLAVSFMHCKNVARVAHPPDLPLQKRTIERHGVPLVTYYTLEIEPMKEVLRCEGGAATEGLQRALHVCRGHFATYTDEKPLFGKHSGTFWVPQHLRGNAAAGIVGKDYKMEGQLA